VGYNESSKAYQIYIPGQRQIEVSIYVTFEAEVAFRRSRGYHMETNSERHEEMVYSPPHPPTTQRKTVEPIDLIDLIDHVALVNVPRNIVVVERDLHRLVKLCRRKKNIQILVVPSKRERDLRYIRSMPHL
jgi:hypothetical protein